MKPTMAILERISKNSQENIDEVFTRLYRYLLRPDIYYARNTLENRLKAKCCELCGTSDENTSYEIHHVNKVKNLKGKEKWEMAMIAKQRKTLVVCFHCHRHVIHKHK